MVAVLSEGHFGGYLNVVKLLIKWNVNYTFCHFYRNSVIIRKRKRKSKNKYYWRTIPVKELKFLELGLTIFSITIKKTEINIVTNECAVNFTVLLHFSIPTRVYLNAWELLLVRKTPGTAQKYSLSVRGNRIRTVRLPGECSPARLLRKYELSLFRVLLG